MKLRKRTDGELAALVVEYTRKAARAIGNVQEIQREQARREKAAGEFFEGQAPKRIPWPCANCSGIFGSQEELNGHKCQEATS